MISQKEKERPCRYKSGDDDKFYWNLGECKLSWEKVQQNVFDWSMGYPFNSDYRSPTTYLSKV